MGYVPATRPMTLFAAYIPFRNGLRLDVVIDGVATIAGGACRAFQIIFRIKSGPPIGPRFDKVREPFMVTDIPLSAERKVIVTDFGKVPLFPSTAVDESNVFALELDDGRVCF